jgi:hypothetical protein
MAWSAGPSKRCAPRTAQPGPAAGAWRRSHLPKLPPED